MGEATGALERVKARACRGASPLTPPEGGRISLGEATEAVGILKGRVATPLANPPRGGAQRRRRADGGERAEAKITYV